jgi:membrane associated rhomboid family serine protease
MGMMTPMVKNLLVINTAIFLALALGPDAFSATVVRLFGLAPSEFLGHLKLWQVVTYLFIHNPFGFEHILFNMLSLWMFGTTIESVWGARRFLRYYIACGVGAGLFVVLLGYAMGDPNVPTIGASGAIYALLLAFGMLFPDATVFFSFLFPMKARYYVMLMGAIVFLSTMRSTGSRVSHIAHLGGLAVGYLYIKFGWDSSRSRLSRRGPGLMDSLRGQYKDWQRRRARRKFEVYMKKRGSGPGDWTH